jgi:hypothetical protein
MRRLLLAIAIVASAILGPVPTQAGGIGLEYHVTVDHPETPHSFRSLTRAATSCARTSVSPVRRSKHCRSRAEISSSAMFNQLACTGVGCSRNLRASPRASSGGKTAYKIIQHQVDDPSLRKHSSASRFSSQAKSALVRCWLTLSGAKDNPQMTDPPPLVGVVLPPRDLRTGKQGAGKAARPHIPQVPGGSPARHTGPKSPPSDTLIPHPP